MNTRPIEPMGAITPRPWVIGLVGGVGSGKSTLANWVAAHHPVQVINADHLGHEALRECGVKARLRARFGDEIFDTDGEILRSRLGSLVFGDDPVAKTQRAALEQVVHPVIRQRIREAIAAVDAGRFSGVLLDAPVLFEAGWSDICDGTVFVESCFEDRSRRVAEARRWTLEELRRRESSQWSVERKRAAATAAVRNDGTVEQGGASLWRVLQEIAGQRRV